MPDLVKGPTGWSEVYPTHCGTGHRFAPHKVIVGWTGTARYFYCLHPDHVDERSRWLVPDGHDGAPVANLGTPDHGLMRS